MYDSANAESCELNGWGEKFWAFLDFFQNAACQTGLAFLNHKEIQLH